MAEPSVLFWHPARSCVEMLKMAGEAVDALFAMDLPMPLGVVRSLAQGIDTTLQRCACSAMNTKPHPCTLQEEETACMH